MPKGVWHEKLVNPRRVTSLTGQQINGWTVGEELPRVAGRHIMYSCTCLCGEVHSVDYYHLKNGYSKSCKTCIKKRVCRKGHDTLFCGREENYKCKLCRVEGHLRRTYDLSLEEYLQLYRKQGGKCAICGRTLLLNEAFNLVIEDEEATRAEVDHEHVAKKIKPQPPKRDLVRGLLCGGRYAGCNAKLGHVDNVEWLEAAVVYLKNPPAQQIRK